MNWREMVRPVLLLLILILSSARVDIASAQVPARIETPYTQVDDETRTFYEAGIEAPLRGNGPLTGYGFLFLTRPHFLERDLYLRLVIAPVYVTSELIFDKWPAPHSAVGVGLSGGLYANSQTEFRGDRFEKGESFSGHSAEATLAYYLRGLMIEGFLPIEGQLRVQPQYVVYSDGGDTASRFRLPENSAIVEGRAGVRLGGVPPDLLPDEAMELSLWHAVSYRAAAGFYGLPERLQETDHLTQQTWIRAGGIFPFGKTQASLFMNVGFAEDTDPLSAFRLGGSLRLRSEFPLVLHGYSDQEIFARGYWLTNVSYRFPIWPGQERVHLEILGDYARVDFLRGHRLPHGGLAGIGADLSFAVTKRITLVVGYGYGINAPRNHGYGGHEATILFEMK